MADASILDPSVAAAPKQYAISGTQELLLKSIAATFDGSAAAVPWVPAIQIIDGAGDVTATYPMDSSLAAGASADVSFFPSLKRGSGGSGGGGITNTVEQVNQSPASVSIANSTSAIILPSTNLSGPVNFAASGGGMRCSVPGVYSVEVNVQLASAAWTAGGGFEFTLAFSGYSMVINSWVTFPSASADVHFPGSIQANASSPPLKFATGDKFFPIVINLDGVAARSYQVQLCSIIAYS